MSIFRKLLDFLLAILRMIRKPKSPTKLSFQIKEWKMAKVAVVKLTWVKSVDTDVVKQVLTVGTQVTELAPDVQEFGPFDVVENTSVSVSLVANDGVRDSVPATLDIVVGKLTPPAAPTNLTFVVVEEKDV